MGKDLSYYARGAGVGSEKLTLARMVDIKDIKVDPELSGLFRIHDDDLAGVVGSMREGGYDNSEPITVWNGVVVDGHTRLRAARDVGLVEVPVVSKQFEDLDAAIAYAVKRQQVRRNLTEAEIYELCQKLERKISNDGTGRSAERLAKILDISYRKVHMARSIAERAGEDVKEAVLSGDMSINEAYNKHVRQSVSKPKDVDVGPVTVPASRVEHLDTVSVESDSYGSGRRGRSSVDSSERAEAREWARLEGGEDLDASNWNKRYHPDTSGEGLSVSRESGTGGAVSIERVGVPVPEEGFADDGIREYIAPLVPFEDIVLYLLGIDCGIAGRVVREFVGAEELELFLDLLPPNVQVQLRGEVGDGRIN